MSDRKELAHAQDRLRCHGPFTVAVVVMELFLEEPPVLLLFGVASLALVGLAWVLGRATESVGH